MYCFNRNGIRLPPLAYQRNICCISPFEIVPLVYITKPNGNKDKVLHCALHISVMAALCFFYCPFAFYINITNENILRCYGVAAVCCYVLLIYMWRFLNNNMFGLFMGIILTLWISIEVTNEFYINSH